MLKKRFIYHTILIILTFVFAANAAAIEVCITGDKLSLEADQVPLQTILHSMADMGIKIRIDPRLNPNISASFKGRNIQKALDAILSPLSYTLLWESPKFPQERIFRLSEIQVFTPGRKDLMRILARRTELSVAKNSKDGSLFVRNEILLSFGSEIHISEFKELLSKLGGDIIDMNPPLGIYKLRFPHDADVPAIVDLLSKYPGIAKAEPNYVYNISAPRGLIPSGLEDADILLTGGKIPVAVLDTGLAPDSVPEGFVMASLDAMNPDEPISDSQGHGTQMALIAAGIVKPHGVENSPDHTPVISVRAFDDNGYTSDFSIMRSIDFALENGARVLSLSWGSETRSDFLEDALDYASSKGLIILASAGNEPTGKPRYPAAYDSVIGVGALAPDGTPWEKSNYGSFVTVSAPGFATLPVGYKGDPGAYAGTSIATAYVANRIANYLSENPRATRQEVLEEIKDKG